MGLDFKILRILFMGQVWISQSNPPEPIRTKLTQPMPDPSPVSYILINLPKREDNANFSHARPKST